MFLIKFYGTYLNELIIQIKHLIFNFNVIL